MAPSLLPHQRLVYTLAKQGALPDAVLLWWSMGSGKTLGGLLCTAGMPPSSKVLVLCDKSLVGQWQGAVDRFVASEYAGPKAIVVKHYQTLTTEHLQPGRYDACLVDESHRFRNAFGKGEASAGRGPTELPAWIAAILRCKRLVYLTGTPIVSDADVERKALERMLRVSPSAPLDGRVFFYSPQEDAKTQRHFASTQMDVVKCPMSYAQALKYFANKQSAFELTLGKETYAVHRPVKNTYNSALVTMSNNPFPEAPAESPKLVEMVRRLDAGFRQGEKQLVYSQRLETGIQALRDHWLATHPETKKAVFFIDGSQAAELRTQAVARFNRGGKERVPRILFISDAASQGVDLKEVDAVHLLEPGDRLQEERQVINRAIRFKAHKSKEAQVRVHLYCTTFDPKRAALGPLQATADALGMFDGRSGGGFVGELKRALDRRMATEKLSVDERTLLSREAIDRKVQAALAALKGYAYRARAPSTATPRPSVAMPAALRDAATPVGTPRPAQAPAVSTPRAAPSGKKRPLADASKPGPSKKV